ncbi:hypothetical protein NW759_017181 [Fusarium solani]|nr:hypothetical protein NW759_017181 [Fusarium solani]
MRADVLHSIQGDLRPKVRNTILDDHVDFCRKGLSAALVNVAQCKRGRPRRYSTSESKAAADVERRWARRQNAAPVQRDTVHANSHSLVFPLLPLPPRGGAGWVNVFSDFYNPANPTDIPEPDKTDISQFLPRIDPQPLQDIEEHVMADIETFTEAIDTASSPNHGSPGAGQAVAFDTASEISPQTENSEPDPVGHLAQELAEQLVKFQGCCNDCHIAAQRNHMEDPNEQISLAMYLEFTPELGPDVLSKEAIAHQKDDLAGKMSPEYRRQAFCGLDSRAEIPHICLDEDERVSNDAGVTFDVDSVVAFPSNLAVAKRGIHWSPTRMAVSDLQSDLHL